MPALILIWRGWLSFWERSNTHFDMTATYILIWLDRLVLLWSSESHFEIKDFSPSCLRSKRQSFFCHKKARICSAFHRLLITKWRAKKTEHFLQMKDHLKAKKRKKAIKILSYQTEERFLKKRTYWIRLETNIIIYNDLQRFIHRFLPIYPSISGKKRTIFNN